MKWRAMGGEFSEAKRIAKVQIGKCNKVNAVRTAALRHLSGKSQLDKKRVLTRQLLSKAL